MQQSGIGLSPQSCEHLFPFHIVFNRELRVVQTGGALRQGSASLAPGDRLDLAFQCQRPTGGWQFERFCADPESVYVLQALNSNLRLRGGMTYLQQEDVLLFLGSPWITELSDLQAVNLRLTDFPAHDPLPDLWLLLQAQTSSVAELSLLTEQLSKARDDAERAVLIQNQFLTKMSHEIRTPLHGILGMTDLALRSKLDSEQHARLTTVKSSAATLLLLVNDVLDYAKLQAGELTLEPVEFEICLVIEDTLRALLPEADAKGLRLLSEIDPAAAGVWIGDALRLRQILLNLVGNAVKFTHAGQILVHVRLPQMVSGTSLLEVTVTDTGIGIAAEQLDTVFAAFTQADGSATRRFGGAGLGLSISRRLADAMGGSLTATSIPGQGSSFTLTVGLERCAPAIPSVAPPAVSHSASRSAGKGSSGLPPLSVLVVEDNPVNQLLTASVLRKNGHTAELANNGQEAVELYQQGRFDLILMDVLMPVMGGYDATAAIRRLEGDGLHVPIVAVTANAMKGDRERCLASGMDGYVSKPIAFDKLWSECRRVLAQSMTILKEHADRGAHRHL